MGLFPIPCFKLCQDHNEFINNPCNSLLPLWIMSAVKNDVHTTGSLSGWCLRLTPIKDNWY
eukprot:11788048-Ditylum_brightwellii.AAC.1